MGKEIALILLQLVALAIPPVTIMLRMLRRSENIEWKTRRFSFVLASGSILLYIGAGIAVLAYLLSAFALPTLLQVALVATILGLLPFALFTGIVYREHRQAFG